jgi:predicted nuclease of restriction endonuclease-like (RecB) superfamily
MNEAADSVWSTRQMDRQISTLYYERLLASKDKTPVVAEAKQKMSELKPEQFIHDPFVLEFLNLKEYPALRESDIEQALIDHLQQFLLELGRGFCFVARQKRMRYDEDDFYVDLVFYHSILKCHVLIDLKLGKLTHEDVGQMDSYIRMFDALYRNEDDNPTLGIILCSQKSEAIVKYSVLNEGKQIFASRYKLYLPTEEEFKQMLESI